MRIKNLKYGRKIFFPESILSDRIVYTNTLRKIASDLLLQSYKTNNFNKKNKYVHVANEILWLANGDLNEFAIIKEKHKTKIIDITKNKKFVKKIINDIIEKNKRLKHVFNLVRDLIEKPNLVNLEISEIVRNLVKGKQYSLIKGKKILKKVNEIKGIITIFVCNKSVNFKELRSIAEKIEKDTKLFDDLIWGAKIVEDQKKTEVYNLLIK